QRLQGHLVETHCLLVGCKRHGPGTGTPCIVDGFVYLYALGGLQEVMGELPVVLLQPISKQGLQCKGHTPVQVTAPGHEETAIGCFLRKGVLEEIGRLRQHTTCVEELSVCEGIEVDQEFLICETSGGLEDLPEKLTAYDCTHLEHAFGFVRQPIDAGHED